MSNYGSAASQPTSFAANVNRAKTKKWVEAKSYSYDGDDWGEVDDYDEYGGYGEPEPPPAPKPTGLRQRGQSASQVPQEPYESRQDLYQSPVDSRQPHGFPVRPPVQHQPGSERRSFTNPQPQAHPALARTHSFDRDDERRAFSAASAQSAQNEHHPPTSVPAQGQATYVADDESRMHSQMRPDPAQLNSRAAPAPTSSNSDTESPNQSSEQSRLAGENYRGGPYLEQARQPAYGSRTQSMTSNTPALDPHSRRDFSPSAMPPPLQTRGSPSPHGPDSRSSSRHPPRKSSLGQDNAPQLSSPVQSALTSSARESEGTNLIERERASSGGGKALPFVRPADIYRRMQEEREKERQSQESTRPSTEALLGRPNERPGLGKSQDSDSSPRVKPNLDPVSERKSEYAMEGLSLKDQETQDERRPTSSKTFAFPKRTSEASSQAPSSSLGPILPDVSRVSGFGESFFGSTDTSGDSQAPMLDFSGSSSVQPPIESDQTTPKKDLQHQPSLGFTSAVHQAFDKAEDQVPPTPSSTQGSSIGRSASGGTSTVSPIISRGPSTATDNISSRLGGIDNFSTPMIPEGPEGRSSRPLSSSSLGKPAQIAEKSSPSGSIPPLTQEVPPPTFIPGYRRNSDTPSPDNSPRRTPALELNRQLRHPQEIELGAATPTEINPSAGGSSEVPESISDERSSPLKPPSNFTTGISPGTNLVTEAATTTSPNTDFGDSPVSPSHNLRERTDSSGNSRVRNLADKFESGSRPGSAQSTTPRASIIGANSARKDDLLPPRPLADRMESFRPHLPGGWESSASIAPANAYDPSKGLGPGELNREEFSTKPNLVPSHKGSQVEEDFRSSSPSRQPSSLAQVKDASEEAFAAVAAAGSALAGAFGSAVGVGGQEPPSHANREVSKDERILQRQSADHGIAGSDQGILHPEASRELALSSSDDEASDLAHTPISNDLQMKPSSPDHQQVATSESESERRLNPNEKHSQKRHTPKLPLLSTGTSPQQYESDRLRKEIVRELTPLSGSEPTTTETDYSSHQPTPSSHPSGTRPGHESGVLPREYDSYWNDAVSEDEAESSSVEPSQVEDPIATHNQQGPAVIKPLQTNRENEHYSASPPLQNEDTQNKPRMLPHRFSWEQPLQHIAAQPNVAQEETGTPSNDFLRSTIYPEGHVQSQGSPFEAAQPNLLNNSAVPPARESVAMHEKELPSPKTTSDLIQQPAFLGQERDFSSEPEPAQPVSEKYAVVPSNVEPAMVSGKPDQRHSITDASEKLEREHPLPSLPPDQPPSSSAQLSGLPPMPSPTNTQPRIPAFREILALKTPHERIRAYNDTRVQFANLNTGLAHWIVATANTLPEHGDLLASSGYSGSNVQGHRPSPSRSKLSGFLPSGSQSSPQPHYQQISDMNSQPSALNGNASGANIGGGMAPGVSPGGSRGKLSSQQVQAKGKDLLQSAGVFGGKANVAAKGLFSKGKSKLRAASGNEKAPSQRHLGDFTSRGMQQQPPDLPAQSSPQISQDIDTTSGSGAQSPYASSPANKPSENPQGISPRETPSLESFTQSQLGDDERSSESEPSNYDIAPRTNSLYFKHGLPDLDSDVPVQNDPSITGTYREASLTRPYLPSPKESKGPISVASSNGTPTQANFVEASPISTAPDRRDVQIHQTGSESHGPLTTKNNARGLDPPVKQSSVDSGSTIRYLNDSQGAYPVGEVTERPVTSQDDNDRLSRAPARMNALRASEVLTPTSPTARDKEGIRFSNSPRARSRTRSRDSLGVPGTPHETQVRRLSNDGSPFYVDPNRPPSPPFHDHQMAHSVSKQQVRAGPIHYGLDHDFVPDSDYERRRRSRSYSRSSANQRVSQESQSYQEHSQHEHTAPGLNNSVPSQQLYREASRGSAHSPRPQAPEYDIDTSGPALEWPAENKPRSRRGSRSSAFFKSITSGSSVKADDEPPLPDTLNSPLPQTPVASPVADDKQGKRISLLRSLTGNSQSGSGNVHTKEPTPIATYQGQPNLANPTVEDDEFPPRGKPKSATSKFNKRLQKSVSSAAAPGSEGTKKKRFSGLGSLFGRGTPKRQSTASARTSQAPLSSHTHLPHDNSHTNSSNVDPQWREPNTQQEEYISPPPGGYYAPRTYASPSTSSPRTQRRAVRPDSTAYAQDTTLRHRMEQRESWTDQSPKAPPPRSSATFPRSSPKPSTPSVPRSSTTKTENREGPSEGEPRGSKLGGSAWTRFSHHGRSKSRHEQQRSSSNTSQQLSPQQPDTFASPISSENYQRHQPPYHHNTRADSPPPPPPPPKDEWHQARPRKSSLPTSRSNPRHAQSFSQNSIRPVPAQNRQSLPPLETNVASTNHRKSGIMSAKTLTPEEKRKSRQQQIEYSTLPHQSPVHSGGRDSSRRVNENEDEPVVMSATSFPGQEWQPSYAHWDGD